MILPLHLTHHQTIVMEMCLFEISTLISTVKVMYHFYKKPIPSDFVTLKSTAMTMKQKFNILTQQCFFRLHNTIEEADIATKVEIFNDLWKIFLSQVMMSMTDKLY